MLDGKRDDVEDSKTDAFPGSGRNPTRRSLLGAAGLFALSASGLILPSWLEEAEAREGLLGGDHGGRHGKDRRGHDKHRRRDHGDKNDQNQQRHHDGARGIFEMRYMALFIHNYRPVPVQVQGWQFEGWQDDQRRVQKWVMPDGWGWKTLAARAADGSHSAAEFISGRYSVAVQIGTDRVVQGHNSRTGFPEGIIRSGGFGEKGPVGGRGLNGSGLWVNETIAADGIKITRIGDSDDHIRLSVDLV